MFSDYHWTVVKSDSARKAFLEAKASPIFENFTRYCIVNPNNPIRFDEVENALTQPIVFRKTRNLDCIALHDNTYFFFTKKSNRIDVDLLFLKNIGYILHEGKELTIEQLDTIVSTAQRLRTDLVSK